MRYYFDSGPKDRILFKEFLFLAIRPFCSTEEIHLSNFGKGQYKDPVVLSMRYIHALLFRFMAKGSDVV